MKIINFSSSSLSSFCSMVKKCPGKVYNFVIALLKAIWYVVTFLPKQCFSILTYPFRKKQIQYPYNKTTQVAQNTPKLPAHTTPLSIESAKAGVGSASMRNIAKPLIVTVPLSTESAKAEDGAASIKAKKKVSFSLDSPLIVKSGNKEPFAHLEPIEEETIYTQVPPHATQPKILHLPFERKGDKSTIDRQQMADLASTAPLSESPQTPSDIYPPQRTPLQPPLAPEAQEAYFEEDFYLFPPRARPKTGPLQHKRPLAQKVPKTDFLDDTEAFFKDVTGAVSGFFDTLLLGFQPDRSGEAPSKPIQTNKKDPKDETFFAL
ncbi:MAG: hypothetical protein FJZ60_01425 [Chlamydiae bacterium]|nr:hypothetical protein [Chlamydiota bacterium]